MLNIYNIPKGATGGRSYPMPLSLRPREAAGRSNPTTEARGGGREDQLHAPKPEAGGSGREDQPHAPKPEAGGGGREDQPHT